MDALCITRVFVFRSSGNDVPVLHRHRHTVLVHAGRLHDVRAVLRCVRGLGAVAPVGRALHPRVAVLSDEKKPAGPGGRLVADAARLGRHDRGTGDHQGETATVHDDNARRRRVHGSLTRGRHENRAKTVFGANNELVNFSAVFAGLSVAVASRSFNRRAGAAARTARIYVYSVGSALKRVRGVSVTRSREFLVVLTGLYRIDAIDDPTFVRNDYVTRTFFTRIVHGSTEKKNVPFVTDRPDRVRIGFLGIRFLNEKIIFKSPF